MTVADGIRKFGFRRWYERALMEGHAFLAAGFLGMILAFCGIEALSDHGGAQSLAVSAIAIGTYVTVIGLRRYRCILILANRLSKAATCEGCHAYAMFSLKACGTPQRVPASPPRFSPQWLRVCCDKCEHEWTIVPFAAVLAA